MSGPREQKIRREPTAAEAANIVDRYRRGQGIEFIRLATDFSRPRIVETLKAAGVPIRRPSTSNRNWGWTGGAP